MAKNSATTLKDHRLHLFISWKHRFCFQNPAMNESSVYINKLEL